MPDYDEFDGESLLAPSLWGVVLLITDLLIYGLLFPIGGVYFAGSVAVAWDLDPFQEIILVILSVFAILLLTFYAHLETKFWAHLFAREEGFIYILQTRDWLNLVILAYYTCSIFHSIGDMISDHEMKKFYLSEGLGFIVLKPLVDRGLISDTWLDSCKCQVNLLPTSTSNEEEGGFVYNFLLSWAQYFGLFLPQISLGSKNVDCVKDKFVHGAQFVFAIAGLTASITKVVYFNTLYAYLRAMDIFVSMQPDEGNEDDDYYDDNDMDDDTNEDKFKSQGKGCKMEKFLKEQIQNF